MDGKKELLALRESLRPSLAGAKQQQVNITLPKIPETQSSLDTGSYQDLANKIQTLIEQHQATQALLLQVLTTLGYLDQQD